MRANAQACVTQPYHCLTRPGRRGTLGAAITLLETGDVELISLDHDLGHDENGDEMTGYQVLLWIEEAVALRGLRPVIVADCFSSPISFEVKSLTKIVFRAMLSPSVEWCHLGALNLLAGHARANDGDIAAQGIISTS